MKRLLSKNGVGAAAFLAAAALYGLFGSPTPDNPGTLEAAVLALLVLAMLTAGLSRKVFEARWSLPLLAFLTYGFTVPLLGGALAGNTGADMLRDLLGFAAFALPVAFYGIENPRVLFAAMAGIGFVFAGRYVASPDVLSSLLAENLLYLANSPLVPFAGAWLLLHGSFVERRWWLALLCVAASFVPMIAMAGMMQRATLALMALVWLGFLAVSFVRNPRRAIVVAGVATALLATLWSDASALYGALVLKTEIVGWNARGAELAALLSAQSQNPLTALFGTGWGSLFKSPAVGEHWVRFSHSLLTSLWWKAGWVGLVLGVVALASLVRDAYGRLRRNFVLFWSLILPLLPAMFLYGSYKSLCFGLLLLGLTRMDWTMKAGSVNQTADYEHARAAPLDSSREPRLSADARGDGAFAS